MNEAKMDPRRLPETGLEWREFRRWVRAKVAEFQADEDVLPARGVPQEGMIRYWKQFRPRMVRRLKAHGLLEDLAYVLDCLKSKAEDANLESGLGWPDSREMAEREWLLMEPEHPEA